LVKHAFYAWALSIISIQASGFAASMAGLNWVWLPPLALLLLAILLLRVGWVLVGLKPFRPFTTLGLTALTITATYIAAQISSSLLTPPAEYLSRLEQFLPKNQLELFLSVIMSYLVVAPGEELVFRGVIHAELANSLEKRVATLLSAIIFAASHLDIYRLFPTLVLGLLTGYSLNKTGSLFPSLIIHGSNNAVAYLISYAYS